MNKAEFIILYTSFIKQYDINPNDVHASHGGALLMMGLRQHTSDIDLTVTKPIWDLFPNCSVIDLGGGTLLKSITPVIDIHITNDIPSDDEIFQCGLVRFRSLERTLKDKIAMRRDKDIPDIKMLQSILNK